MWVHVAPGTSRAFVVQRCAIGYVGVPCLYLLCHALSSVCCVPPLCTLCHSAHADDTVYMEDASQRTEYVQNGSGKMWVGSHDNMGVFYWEYEQVLHV